MTLKNELRKKYLSLRKELCDRDVDILSNKVYSNLRNIFEYSRSTSFMIYLDYKKEVKTTKIIQELLNYNKTVIIPISKPNTIELGLSKLNSFSDLEIGTYGILEPKKNKIIPVSPEVIDMIIVPGVVFDRNGYRIGYGKGYYDRFLGSLDHEFTTVGLCYDLQLIDEIPRGIFDYKLDYITTNNEVIKIKK